MRTLPLAVVIVAGLAPAAHGDLMENVLTGFNIMGFGTVIERDYLQDGWNFRYAQVYSDDRYDFGNTEILLNGRLGGRVSIGRRGLDELGFALLTEPPLAYQLVYYDGANRIEIGDGLIDVDTEGRINQFGFYDVRYQSIVKGTMVIQGEVNTTKTFEYVTPAVDIHGHWLVDLVNLTLGRWMGFTLPGGATNNPLFVWDPDLQRQLAEEIAQGIAKTVGEEGFARSLTIAAPVPEPAAVVLLLLGVPLAWRLPRK